jgi:DNA-binding NarL/FixJ family response regulator
VDDHALFRAGLKELLTRRGFEVIGEAANGREAVALVESLAPDLVLMDLQMPEMSGLEAIRLIKAQSPALPVVVLTASEDDTDLFEAIKSGAQGYLMKGMDPNAVISLIEAASRGEPALTPHLAAKILAEFARTASPRADPAPPPPTAEEPLTPRELQVLSLLTSGLSNKEIARRLSLSENTVKFHLKNILQKLHLQNRSQVVAYALRHGLAGGTQGH